MPTLWSLCSTKGIYQTTETSSGLPSAGGMSSDNIPGQSTVLTPGQGQTTTYGSTNQSALRGLRTDGQPQEVDSITCPELGIPGVQHQLPNNANITTSREDEENTTGFQSITGSAVSISSSDSPVCGQDNSYPASPTNSSSALQSSTVSDELGCSSQLYPGRDNRQVQHYSTTGPREQNRSNMVELTEQEGFINPCYTTSTISDHRVRCIQPGLGCCTGGTNPDWRSLDGRGSNASYQLSGTASSLSCDQGIWEGLKRHSSPTPYGQYNSSFICQSQGRYNLSQAVQTSHHDVDLVHFSEHHIDSRTPSRPPQCDSRPGIVAGQGPLRLDAQSPCLLEDSGEHGTAGGRSVCLSPDKATTTLLQLRADPEAAATDAFMQDWSHLRGFVNPPWCLISRYLSKVKAEGARIVLVTPLWNTQPWFPVVLELLEDYPRQLVNQPDLVVLPVGQEFLMKQGVPQLIAWPISGNLTHHKAFLQRLQTSCLPHGEIKPILTTVPPLLNGLAGVSNEVEIPFLDL